MIATGPVAFHHRVEPEDEARANVYGLLASLYERAPDSALLARVGHGERLPDPDSLPFARSYNRLADASVAMDASAARQEYFDLFVGVGKCEVNLHASHWLSGYMMEKPLAELRTDLQRLGIARRSDASLVEDHLALLCETMRMLIVGDGGLRPAPLGIQHEFFEKHLGEWVFRCCDAISSSQVANYYACVAEWTTAFLAIERDSLAME